MEIIIKCESMQELKSITESLFVDLPEGNTKKQKKKPEEEDKESAGRARAPRVDKDEVVRLYNKGMKAPEIANYMGTQANTIYNILSKLRKEGRIL